MKIDSFFLFLQRDFLSLKCFADGKNVSIEDVKRRLFLNQRNINNQVSNHYFKLENNEPYGRIRNFSDLFLEFQKFADKFLAEKEKRIYVQDEKFIEWHNTISFISPLLLISAFIENNFILKDFEISTIQDYFQKYICPNTRNTALLSPECIPLRHFFEEKQGFYDLHIHLNGITETDSVWQNLLNDIEKNMNEISKGFLEEDNKFDEELKVKDCVFEKDGLNVLLEQNGLTWNSSDLRELLYKARFLKNEIFNIVFGFENRDSKEFYISPFLEFFNENPDAKIPSKLLRYESLMYVIIFRFIKEKRSETGEYAAKKFYEYLLIQGLFAHLLCHDKTQFGFQQFQEITNTKLREESDKSHISKFFQLCGNDESLPNFRFAEFRFSPKDSVEKNMQFVRQFEASWKNYSLDCESNDIFLGFPEGNLIAHFIKKSPNLKSEDVYFDLRLELNKKTDALIGFIKQQNQLSKKLVAVDVASSEFDTPPEIFAPYFWKLREKGIKHFTYHAGEDFYHVLSGLRAIYETVEFCGLKKADRIGHAAAAGINIQEWQRTVNDSFCISKNEWFDNLVFAVSFIKERNIKDLYNIIPILLCKIEELVWDVYEKSASFPCLEKLWRSRRLAFHEQKKAVSKNSQDLEYFVDYRYSPEYFERQNKQLLDSSEIEYVSLESLEIIQAEILKYLHEKEIVIETLPTSNFRIGFYNDFSFYQLFNWFDLYLSDKTLPPIVLGTDDPGIFSTNIFNEYALVYCHLVYESKKERNKVLDFLEILYRNAEIYAFR